MVDAIIKAGGDDPKPGSRRRAGGPNGARHELSTARALFNWAVERDTYGLAGNPIVIKAKTAHGRAPRRTRVLEPWEVRAVWRAAGAPDLPLSYGPIIRMLLLTGQRLNEIARARWSEVDLDDASEGPEIVREWRNMLGTLVAQSGIGSRAASRLSRRWVSSRSTRRPSQSA
jgi:integrase